MGLKMNDIQNMSDKERKEKLEELKMEIMKRKVASSEKSSTKEIKKNIARILTFKPKK